MRLIVLSVTLNLLTPSWGQQVVTFDTVRFNPSGRFAIGCSVFEQIDGYLVYSIQKALDTLNQDVFVDTFDPDGGLVSELSYASFQQDYFGASSAIAVGPSGTYVGVSRFGLVGPLDSLFLYKFDPEGDTLWTRFVNVDTTLTMRGTAIEEVDGDVLLCGLHDPGNEAYVYHLDSLGDIKGYHGYAGFDGEDVVEGRDGKWYVCGIGNQQSNYSRGVLVRSDTTGTQIWRRTLTDAAPGWFRTVIALRDSSVVCLGPGAPDEQAYGNFAMAIKYDTAGNMIWRKDLYESEGPSWPSIFNAGYEALDGSLVLAGQYRSFAIRDAGLLVKLAATGDTLWHRFYSHYPGAAYFKDQIFYDVKPTSDGGMVLTGETNSDDYPYAQLWLLKLDSAGCLVPGCGSVGVEEYLDVLQPLLRVSPNPASDVVHVAMDLPEGAEVRGDVRAVLLDATGRVVLEQKVQQSFNALRSTVDVSALPSGTYYLHMRDAKRWLAGSKVVVQ